ncbi:substance-P receptor-like [Mya arenaria]|uniref:substance-P receptor-like n=1 Tax=Mya arenaria TaxID=6604 RepID=UPI0022E4C626|nr:substance-P receptor-like [Mya arenaria]
MTEGTHTESILSARILTVSVYVSVLTLGAIAVERYFAICHPLSRSLTASKVSLFIVVIWIVYVIVALPELLYQKLHRGYPEYITDYPQYCPQILTKQKQKLYQISLMIGLFDIPIRLTFYAYTTIAIILWKDGMSENVNNRLNARVTEFDLGPDTHVTSIGKCVVTDLEELALRLKKGGKRRQDETPQRRKLRPHA